MAATQTAHFEVLRSGEGVVIRMSPRIGFGAFVRYPPRGRREGADTAPFLPWLLWAAAGSAAVVLLSSLLAAADGGPGFGAILATLLVPALLVGVMALSIDVAARYLAFCRYRDWQVSLRPGAKVCFAGQTLCAPRQLTRELRTRYSEDGDLAAHAAVLRLTPRRGDPALILEVITPETPVEALAQQEGEALERLLRRELALPAGDRAPL